MNSAETPSFSPENSPGADTSQIQSEIQERSPSRANPVQNSDRSDQNSSHRGGGERPPNITDFPTQEELARQLENNAPEVFIHPETSSVFSASPDDETPSTPGPAPTGKTNNYEHRDELTEFQAAVEKYIKDDKADLEAVRFAKEVILPQQGLSPQEIEALGPRETLARFANNPAQFETLKASKTVDPPDRDQVQQAENISENLSKIINTEIDRQEVEKDSPVATTSSEIPTTTEQIGTVATTETLPINQAAPEKIDTDPLTSSARELVDRVVNPGDQLGDLKFSEQKEVMGLKYRVYLGKDGQEVNLRPDEEIDHARMYLENQGADKPDLNTKVQLTPSEMDQLIAEKQRQGAGPSKAGVETGSEEAKPSRTARVFSAAETARAKVAEVARAAALRTPGGKFVYKAAERYLNNFDWRDKDKVAWATGIAAGFTTNTVLNMVLPGAGGLINSVGTTAATHVLSGGLNALRLRGIESSIKQGIKDFGEGNSRSIDIKDFRNQYDQASQLLKTNGMSDYQTEMTKISKDLLSRLGYKEETSLGLVVETLTQELQNKVFKYSKANERIRSFAAGMKVGAVTSGITDRFFNVEDFIKDKFTQPETPTLSQDQVNLINSIHQDPEAWKTFTSLSPEQWENVGKLYEANRLAEIGIPANPIIETLTNTEVGQLVDINPGDNISTLLQNNGHEVTWTSADADLFGGHILANHQLLAETHDRMVDSGLATGNFPTQAEVLNLTETARSGNASALHELQSSLDWIPANEKLRVLSSNELSDLTDYFERKASEEISEGLTN